MAAIHDLIAQIGDQRLRERLTAEWARATRERKFGLVFEEHLPELLPLPKARPRKGDLVAPRGGSLKDLWRVRGAKGGRLQCVRPQAEAEVVAEASAEFEPAEVMVVREFGEPIFPALVPVDVVANGGADAPWHTLIEADNYHALQLLEYLYAGQVDCIYIDPPYNTGARDWKYNNDYVDGNDAWRHSKWLAFMKRRLTLARALLRPSASVLVVTIDENELYHLGLVIEEIFAGATHQIVTSTVNPRGIHKDGCFARCDEYLLFVMLGGARVLGEADIRYSGGADVPWRTLRRSDLTSARGTQKGGTRQFYPIYVNDRSRRIEAIGAPLSPSTDRHSVPMRQDCTAVLPVRSDGTEMNWGLTGESLERLLRKGFVAVGAHRPDDPQPYVISYLTSGRIAELEAGKAQVVGRDESGTVIARYISDKDRMPLTNWNRPTHNAEIYGSNLLRDILGDKRFPFPKSLYAVADCCRFFLRDKPDALIVDFFGGSGTTLHAVLHLNAEDSGRRRCILVTNNEVSAVEAGTLRERGLSPGDDEWEAEGICRSVTWPRSKFTVVGRRDDGTPLPGEYLTGRSVQRDKHRRFVQIGFVEPAQIDTPAKKKQVVALVDGLPQTLVADDNASFIVSEDHAASVLFDPAAAEAWLEALDGQDHVGRFFIVTSKKKQFEQIKDAVDDLLGPLSVPEDETRPMRDGFAANLAYFKLDFLDPERVNLKRAFREILPLLWLKAGAVGPRPELPAAEPEPALLEPEGNNFIVLLQETRLARLLRALVKRSAPLSHVFIVTDSDESFKRMAAEVRAAARAAGAQLQVVQLYRDYLVNFLINQRQEGDGDAAAGAAA